MRNVGSIIDIFRPAPPDITGPHIIPGTSPLDGAPRSGKLPPERGFGPYRPLPVPIDPVVPIVPRASNGSGYFIDTEVFMNRSDQSSPLDWTNIQYR